MVHLLAKRIIVIRLHVVRVGARRDERRLGLGRLALLAALVGGLFLLLLLVAGARQRARNLFNLLAGQLLGELLGKLFQKQAVLALFAIGGNDGHEHLAQLLKLLLGLRVEDGQLGQVDRVGGVLGVDGDRRPGDRVGAVVADADAVKQVLGVAQVGLLLGAAETRAALALLLLLLRRALLLEDAGALLLVLGDALRLGLLVGGVLGGLLLLELGGFLGLFALYVGVLGGIPRVEDLENV